MIVDDEEFSFTSLNFTAYDPLQIEVVLVLLHLHETHGHDLLLDFRSHLVGPCPRSTLQKSLPIYLAIDCGLGTLTHENMVSECGWPISHLLALGLGQGLDEACSMSASLLLSLILLNVFGHVDMSYLF